LQTGSQPAPIALEARAITKRYGDLIADDNVDFQLRRGEIHALLGENGAGKTTLCNILYGFVRHDSGEILVKGSTVKFGSPKDAIRAGIGMVHQELMLIPNMSVLENLSLTLDLDYRHLALDLDTIKEKLLEMEKAYGLPVEPDVAMENLSVGERQRVEILKCLYLGAEILLLDEPTSFLTEIESEKLFESLTKMAREGKSVVFVTHKIDEVMAIADRITILKQGKVVAVRDKTEVTKDELARLIVGREVLYEVQRVQVEMGAPTLELQGIYAKNDSGAVVVRDTTFAVRAGEILGIAGVAGNGQRELDEVITGMRKATSGRLIICGKTLTNRSADEIRRTGVAHVCEEHKTGLIFNFSLLDNLIISPFIAEKFRNGIFVHREKLRSTVKELIQQYSIAASSEDVPFWTLSGGNKQKFLLARELFWGPKVIVANNPTKGLDVAAAEYVRNTLMKEKANGKAIVMISSDIDEVLDMSDVIAVMNRGRIMKLVDSDKADLHEIAYLMTTSSDKQYSERETLG
jgi:simple sugar transport system ATP-binding protein